MLGSSSRGSIRLSTFRCYTVLDKEYQFKREKYPDIHIPNRALAHHLSFQDDHSEEVESVRNSVEEYNRYLAKLEAIPGFSEFFKQHGFCVSREAVSEKWSEEIADFVFSKKGVSMDFACYEFVA